MVLGVRSLLPDLSQSAGDGASPAATYVRDLLPYLTGQAGGDPADTVAARPFDLHVARYVMQPDGVIADQALELIQMSSDTRTSPDPRTLATEKLTGLQLHHFGAFCKASWRANDWMWGRLDGAGWLGTGCSIRAGGRSWRARPRPGRLRRRAAGQAAADRG